MIFSLFCEGAFILKSEILGGRSFKGAFIRGNTVIRTLNMLDGFTLLNT